MTIDEAIRYTDMLANDASTVWEIPRVEIQRLNTLCADALRLMKRTIGKPKGEYHETKERYEKLHRMVTKYEDGTLNFTPNCSIDLLKQQKRHMGEYLHDLEIRAEIEGVNLYD